MDVQIEPSWKRHLAAEFEKPYFANLTNFVRREYHATTCYPPGRLIFNAFNLCPFDKVKVVIIGQDPYHGPGQAHGLCFSVNDGVAFPPSLQNIFKEIHDDLGTPVPQSGNLTRWAEQGVLLLNATLTVRAHQAGSHQRQGWEEFTDAAIKALAEEREHLVFILWGAYAQKKGRVHRSQPPSGACVGPSVALVRLPRLFRQQAFQPGQRLFGTTRGNPDKMVRKR